MNASAHIIWEWIGHIDMFCTLDFVWRVSSFVSFVVLVGSLILSLWSTFFVAFLVLFWLLLDFHNFLADLVVFFVFSWIYLFGSCICYFKLLNDFHDFSDFFILPSGKFCLAWFFWLLEMRVPYGRSLLVALFTY